MELTIEQPALLKALGRVKGATAQNAPISIASPVLLTVDATCLTMRATDLDIQTVDIASCTVARPGEITTSALELYKLAYNLPVDAYITLCQPPTTSDGLEIVCGPARYILPSSPVRTFAFMPGADDPLPWAFTLPAHELLALWDKTAFAMLKRKNDPRYYLRGVYLGVVPDDNVLHTVALDGFCLACFERPIPAGAEAMPSVLVPAAAVNELRKALKHVSDVVRVSLSSKYIKFAFERTCLTARLIEDMYPNYMRFIRLDGRNILEVKRRDLAKAVKHVMPPRQQDAARGVGFDLEKNGVTVTGSGVDGKLVGARVSGAFGGAPLQIGVSGSYISNILKCIDGDTVQIAFGGANDPLTVQAVGNPSPLYVLMPLR